MEMKFWSLMVMGLVVMAVVKNAALANGDITCQQALMDLMSCKEFLVGGGPATPPITCCAGVETVYSAASTKEIRQALCECFKKVAARTPLSKERLKALPDQCHVVLPVPLDPQIDCSKVHLV